MARTGAQAIRPLPTRGSGFRQMAWLLAAGLAWAGSAAHAADLQVNPILVEFAPGEQSQAVWLTNTGTEPLKAQVRVSRWTQQGGEESLEPTRDLLPSPAIVEVAAGQQQLVRVIRPSPVPTQSEAAYRLTIDELPPADDKRTDTGLQFLLRYSIPTFVLAEGTEPLSPSKRETGEPLPPPQVVARLYPQANASLLEVSNPGRQRARLSALSWVDAAGKRTPLVPGLVGYVLAGQRMQWTIPLAQQVRANGGSLKVRFNDDPNEQTLPLDDTGG